MSLVVVNQGEEALLDLLLAVTYDLKLFKNDATNGLSASQIEALDETDFTEADFTGYTDKTLTGGAWTTTPGAPTVGAYAQQTFQSSATQSAQTMYGYYVTRASDGALMWFEEFASPISIEFNLDTILVTPRITLKDEQD